LRDLDHPNIANFYECYQDVENYHFVLEYCGGESLVDYIIKMKYIPEEEVKKIFFQILLAVAYLHDIGVCHRDIKPDNFIFAKKGD